MSPFSIPDGPAGRPTEYEGVHVEPPQWWRHFHNTGQTRAEAIAMLRKLLGDRWQTATMAQAETALTEEDKDKSNTQV